MFAMKNNVPIEPPNSGPRARLIMKYAPPPSIAPFVETAQIERTVKKRMLYAITISRRVTRRPECPNMYPTLRNRIALNMDKQTGVKTPEKVVRVRTPVKASSGPPDPLGDSTFPVAPLSDRNNLTQKG